MRKLNDSRSLKKAFIYLWLSIVLNACSLETSIQSLSPSSDIEHLNRKEPDFIHGEVVMTSGGHQITGVFGEVSETTKSINSSHWEFEGVFYE